MVLAILASIANVGAYDFEVDGFYYNIIGENEVSVTHLTEYICNSEEGISSSYSDEGVIPSYSGEVIIPSIVKHKGTEYKVTQIGERAFLGCYDLTSVSLPEGIVSLEEGAFSDCGIISIVIPNSVTQIGNGVFSGCRELTSVSLPPKITTINDNLFYLCDKLTSIALPESVTSIGKYAFGHCYQLTSISIPLGVTRIETGAFRGCSNLNTLLLPNSVTSIGDEAFKGCESLSTLVIPGSVTSIGEFTFSNCESLTYVDIPKGVTAIGTGAFYECKGLTSLSISESVTSIESIAFADCPNLESIVVNPQNPVFDSRENCHAIITSATNTLIVGCQKTVIPHSVTAIGELAFFCQRNLPSIEIPASVNVIGNRAFQMCESLAHVTLSEGLRRIEDEAFSQCSNLSTLSIPSTVTSVGKNAFHFCPRLASVHIPDCVEFLGSGVFSDCYSLSSITLPSGLTNIPDDFFFGCKSLSTLTLPRGVTSIGDNAFYGCAFTSITLPNECTRIGNSAFKGCTQLLSIDIPHRVREIGESAFYACSNLTSIEIPEGVATIEASTFWWCTELTTITIPSTVTDIGDYAFHLCEKLTLITCHAATPPATHDNTFMVYNTLRVPLGSKEAYTTADHWKNFDIFEGEGYKKLKNILYTGPTDEDYDNRFVFSLEDERLIIHGYYKGNPEVTTFLGYTIVGHDIFLTLTTGNDSSTEAQPLLIDESIDDCREDYYFVYISGYQGTAIVYDYTLHETPFNGGNARGFVRERPPKTDISTGQKDPKESSDVDVVCRVRGIVGGRYQQSVKSIAGRQIVLSGTYHSQEEGNEDVEATTSLGRLDEGEYSITLNVTDEDDVMPPFSATLTFVVGPTGVEMVSCDSDGGDIVFDLQGNRTVTPAGGSIYIVNGKKVLFR